MAIDAPRGLKRVVTVPGDGSDPRKWKGQYTAHLLIVGTRGKMVCGSSLTPWDPAEKWQPNRTCARCERRTADRQQEGDG